MAGHADWVAAAAALAALGLSIYTLIRQRAAEVGSYLVLALAVQRLATGELLISTSLENRSPLPKRLDTVFVLIGPSGEEPTETLNAILRAHGQREVTDIKDFGRMTDGLAAECGSRDRRYVRLDFYTRENSEIGDELVTYDAVVDASDLRSGMPYGIRFFLYGEDRLHRVVQRAIVG